MAHSDRFWFEQWLAQWTGVEKARIRQARDDHGYQDPAWDCAWAAWQERKALRSAQTQGGDSNGS